MLSCHAAQTVGSAPQKAMDCTFQGTRKPLQMAFFSTSQSKSKDSSKCTVPRCSAGTLASKRTVCLGSATGPPPVDGHGRPVRGTTCK